MRKGFTLIELLVVIAIIAVLSVVGVAVYTNILPNVRNNRRQEDVNSIAQSWEKKYNAQTGAYAPLVDTTDFSSGIRPKDPNDTPYVVTTTTNAGGDITSWTVCADQMESSVADFCRKSGQGP